MSGAMALRLAFAVTAALLGGAWLVRTLPRRDPAGQRPPLEVPEPEPPSAPNGRASLSARLRMLVLFWCAVWSAAWLIIALVRLRYPFELEWSGGEMRDHCMRVLQGRPLYVAPNAGWFPYEYPPLYFWTCALVMRLLQSTTFVPLRLVSIASTLVCCLLLIAWIRAAVPGRTGKTWGLIAAGVFLASYRFTGAWYDIERLDMLFLALSLLGGYALLRVETREAPSGGGGAGNSAARGSESATAWLLLAVVSFWLAFLTKQQAVLFLAGGAAALAWRRAWAKLALFTVLSLLLCLISVAWLDLLTHGWFRYYCFAVPAANGIRLHLAAQFFTTDLPLFAPSLVGVALLANRAWQASRQEAHTGASASGGSGMASTATFAAMGIVGSLLSRAHWGGDQNVLITAFVGIIVTYCLLAAKAEERACSRPSGEPRDPRPALYALILLQMFVLVYRPDAQIPAGANRAMGERYEQAVQRLEREGEVLCLDHGGVTDRPHFQTMALLDVIGKEKRLPPDIVQALRSHRYAAILTDARPTPGGALDELARDYQPVECLNIATTWTATGYPTPGPARQVWVLRPAPASPR